MLSDFISEVAAFVLLAFPALFSIVNPLGGAFIFLAATRGMSQPVRTRLARQVATYSFFLLNASMLVGAFVLRVFGISIPVLRVAGGVVIALSAWTMLNAKDDSDQRDAAVEEAGERDAEHMAFYPLTMPVTTGPGTISVAIGLATGISGERNPLAFGRGRQDLIAHPATGVDRAKSRRVTFKLRLRSIPTPHTLPRTS